MEKLEIEIKDGQIYVPLKDKWLSAKPEEIVRQKYVARLVNHYGYDLKQMAQEVKVSNSDRGQGRAYADIVVWKTEKERLENKSAFIVVECKAENITIREKDYFQGFNYASWAGASFFVTTNEKETKYFNVDKEYLPKDLVPIKEIPLAKDINNQSKIKKLLTETKVFERDEFAKLLFACHNIIRNNDKLDPAVAFDEISKILFMKIRYERNPDEEAIFSKQKFLKDQANYEKNVKPYLKGDDKETPYIQILFRHTKEEFKNDDLFDDNETIKIRQNSFEAIVEKLEKYNLSDTSDDVKGIAFEEFLGTTFRHKLGQFFTPRTIVDFMVEILEPQENEIICDPCAGSGGFLIKTFEYIREKIEKDIQNAKDKIKAEYINDDFDKATDEEKEQITNTVNKLFAQLNEELKPTNIESRIYNLSYRSIYGTDANPRMARTAKMNMIMHGDGHGGVHHNDGLLNINGIFENRFDVILTNPPFGSRVEKSLTITENDRYTDTEKIKNYTERYGEEYTNALKQVNDNINKPILDLYDLGTTTGLTEVLFMERCLRLLKPGGRMAIVLPEGVLNNSGGMQTVREYFESRAKIILITSIPSDVFIASGATVKPSLLFLKKFTEQETQLYKQITEQATTDTNEKYQPEIDQAQAEYDMLENELKTTQDKIKELKKELKNKDAVKEEIKKQIEEQSSLEISQKIEVREGKIILTTNLKEIEIQKAIEIKALVKERFDYEIPIAEVEFSGIDSKGAKCENQLKPLAEEFTEYRKQNKLWKTINNTVSYDVKDNNFFRISFAGEPQTFYGKK